MIYSPDNNFLLLKNQKVGGTSLEVVISKIVPFNSIVTPKTSDHPEWKLDDDPVYKDYMPRNYEGFYNHMSYSEIAKKINISFAKSYIFIRNPLDMVLSDFFHRLRIKKINNEWKKFTNLEKKYIVDLYFENKLGWNWLTSNKYIYTSANNEIKVDKFLRYENGIENEINSILPNHNLPKIKLDIYEKAFKPKDIKIREVFSNNQIKLIKESWSWEFEYFKY